MFTLIQSNRFEFLLESLLANLEAEAPGPFDAQSVIVPSAAVRRRIELAQAERLGVCANLEFAFLARWLWRQIGRVVPVAEDSPFAPPVLAWRLHELLADPALAAAHPPLGAYLAAADATMRFDLAQALARVFDHYLTYRPEWLAAWGLGRPAGLKDECRADEAWQAELWRRVAAGLGAAREHPMSAFFAAIDSRQSEASASNCPDHSLSPRERAGVRDGVSGSLLPAPEAGRQCNAAPGARSGAGVRESAVAGLPRSAHLFCLPTLPPLYLDVLRRLSRWMDLHLYVLNPCREYWFEIVDAKRLAYLAARQGDLYHEVGNSLLAAWGRQSKAQLELLFDDAGLIQDQGSAFLPAEGGTLLARLHNAILDLTELAPGGLVLASTDRSVEVHVCHSLTRELEVLHDQLLALFAGPRPPRPADIVVLTPDLDAAAPLIEAVFGTAPAGRRIPFVITGRGTVGTHPVLRAVDALLATVGSRCTASQVLDLLHLPPIARRFGLAPDDLPRIHAWLGEAGIRWGLDEAVPAALDLPAGNHSFASGLDRLFLAYALGDEEPDSADLFAGRLPAGNPEGGAALTLGAWWRLIEALRALDRALSRPLTADAWRAALLNLAADFIAEEREWADELRALHAAIGELHAQMVAGGAASPQPLAVIRSALAALLDEPARGGTPSGAVTFSALTTLRHLPYRVVCLIGMNHGAFPGVARPAEFDLLARHPKPGDRQRRDDERNLFLDAVLAARERLYLSYTGRSIRDASPLPASVLVDELLDYLAAATAGDPADPQALAAARRRLVVEHPLQAFSPAYFLAVPPPLQGGEAGVSASTARRPTNGEAQRRLPGRGGDGLPDPRLFSFNAEYCAALRARVAVPPPVDLPEVEEDEDDEDTQPEQPLAARPFFPAPLPPPGEEWRAPGLDELLRFFRNPCQFLLTRRLGLRLEEGEESPADEEPFLADWPARQALARRLLPALLKRQLEASASSCPDYPLSPRERAGVRERDPDDLLQLAQAGGEYPAGRLGEAELGRELASLGRYAAGFAPALAEPLAPPLVERLDFTLDGEAWSLEGALSDLRPAGLVRGRYDEARATDYLDAWLAHLFLCACALPGVAPRTVWHARDGAFALRPCEAPRQRLTELLALYRRGLMAPLPFFPKSAWAHVAEGGSLGAARKVWHNSRNPAHGEGAKPAYQLALRGRAEPLDGDFEEIARTVFGPLREHLEGAA